MLENFTETKNKKFDLLKKRTRKGIPDSMRGTAWQLFANISDKKQKFKGLYQDLILKIKNKDKALVNIKEEEIIIRDLHRTFPRHQVFCNKLGEGQRALFRVLAAYSNYNSEIGYVQGMGFITALFLLYMDEESAFWLLSSMMKDYNLNELYIKGFPGLRKDLFVMLSLMKRFLPEVYNLLKKKNIYPTMYASQWFFTVFSCVFEFNILLRIFDCFLLEGFKIVYRIALGLFKLKQSELLKHKYFEEIMGEFKNFSRDINVDELIKASFSFSFSRNDIKKYERLYNEKKDQKNDELISQVSF